MLEILDDTSVLIYCVFYEYIYSLPQYTIFSTFFQNAASCEELDPAEIKFQAETDIAITKDNISKYKKWLENIKVLYISNEIILENKYLKIK